MGLPFDHFLQAQVFQTQQAQAAKLAEQMRQQAESPPPRDERVIDLPPAMFEDITDRKALTHGTPET